MASQDSEGIHGGVGTAALCAEFCCCHDEETVVLRFEKRAESDKTKSISNLSVTSSCVVLQEKDEQIAKHEKVTEIHGIENVVF